MVIVERGYMGIASLSGTKFRVMDFNVNLKQEALFYDHTIGLRDSIPSSITGGKGDVGARNEQKVLWRPGTKIVNGSLSFPWTDKNTGLFFEEARKGSTFSLSFMYTCDSLSRVFRECKVNSYTLRATQGDIVTSSVDIIAKGMDNSTFQSEYAENEKLITWDAVGLVIGSINAAIVSFEITINNNCIPIYTSGQNFTNLEPKDIRVGMQTMSGSVSFYNENSLVFVEDAMPTIATFSAGGFSAMFNILLYPMTQQSSVSSVIRTFQMVGVGKNIED